MNQFTKTTIVQPLMKIRRKRLLPTGGEIIVRVGQSVPPLHVLARTPRATEFVVLPIGDFSGMSPAEVEEHLLVKVGESINQGTPLLERKRLIGSRKIESPIDGVLTAVKNGRLVIKQTSDWLELRAMVNGRVINYISDRGITLEIVGALIQGVWATGDIKMGRLHVLGDAPNSRLQTAHINEELDGQILVVGHVDDLELLTNLADNNVAGLIVGSMPVGLYEAAASINISIIMTDGVGFQPMAEPIYTLLQELSSEEASLFTKYDSAKQERPEIIVPRDGNPNEALLPSNQPLAVWQSVRILRPPYQSQMGTVARLFTRSQATAQGAIAHGAEVNLSNGQRVFIPTANLDRFI